MTIRDLKDFILRKWGVG